MYNLGEWCYSENNDNIYTLAAKGGYEMIGIANITQNNQSVRLNIENSTGSVAEVYLLDEHNNLDYIKSVSVKDDCVISLPPYSVISLKIK